MSRLIPDAPDIQMAERTGYPGPRKIVCCPVCGEECETLYKDAWGEIFACDRCVEEVDAWEELNDE